MGPGSEKVRKTRQGERIEKNRLDFFTVESYHLQGGLVVLREQREFIREQQNREWMLIGDASFRSIPQTESAARFLSDKFA